MEIRGVFRRGVTRGLSFDGSPSLTFQEFKDECNLNLLLERAKKGLVDFRQYNKQPIYGDFTHIPDYQACLDKVNQGRIAFNSLSSDVRERFNNNPSKLFEFLNDEKNYDEAFKLGLVKARQTVSNEPNAPVTSKMVDEVKNSAS